MMEWMELKEQKMQLSLYQKMDEEIRNNNDYDSDNDDGVGDKIMILRMILLVMMMRMIVMMMLVMMRMIEMMMIYH